MIRWNRWLKWFFILIGLISLLAISLLTTVDRTPYQQMPYYTLMKQTVGELHVDSLAEKGHTLRAAWYKAALTPAELPYPLAGYGIRKPAESVHDTTYVRTFVFDNGNTRIAYVCVDLLIFPPELKVSLRKKLESKYHLQLYLTATHTHSAPGGWEPKIAGHILAGTYNEEYVALLFTKIEESVFGAIQQLDEVQYAYVKADVPEAVYNRLKGDTGRVDPYLRGIKFKNTKGEEAFLFTYAAHANCMDSDITFISADYPGVVSERLEKSGWAGFVSYAAGAVGSHSPAKLGAVEEDGIKYTDTIAAILFQKVKQLEVSYSKTTTLYYHRLPVYLREPHLRIQKDIRIRPWLFHAALGMDDPDIQIMQIGNIILFGMPCDYAGELMPPLEDLCEQNGKHFILSGFNGGYVGYINDDVCYDWQRAETMDMNWYGPYNAAYFTEINQRILKKMMQLP